MVTEKSHTPGPWTTDESDHDQLYLPIKIRSGKHRTICTVLIDDAPVPDFNSEQEANAHLIAAAPDLLAVLEEACDPLSGYLYGPVLDRARAAIAKAKGGA